MMNVIIREGLYDKAFVDEWTVGFERLEEHVKSYPVSRVAEICWVPEERIVEAARLYATTRPACIEDGNPLDDDLNSVQSSRAVSILRSITGNLGIPGGDVDFGQLPIGVKSTYGPRHLEKASFTLGEKLTENQKNKIIGGDKGFAPVAMTRIVPPQLLTKAMLNGDPYPGEGPMHPCQ